MTTKDGDEMRSIATTYYKRLLTEDSMNTGEGTREYIILQSIPQKVTTEMNTWLTRPLSIIEIWEALSDLDADRCPEIDSLAPHFFTSLWDTIKEDLFQAHEDITTSGNMQRNLNRG